MWCKTRSARLRRTIKSIADWCRGNRHKPVKVQHEALCRRIQGHYNYFGVSGNFRCLLLVQQEVRRAWPAFAAQSVVAPSDIVLSAPVCAGLECDVDRTQDLAVAWTGGGAGKVRAAFETVGSTSTGSVFCTFDAASGMGTVPKTALAVLGDTRDGSTTGVEIFESLSETTFTVGDIPTTFSVQSGGIEALMNVTK